MRTWMVFVELIPFKVTDLGLFVEFRLDDVVVLICKVAIGNIGITGRVTPDVT